jgi:hypothetical protein
MQILCGKEYDKLYINDPDMKLAAKQLKVRNYFSGVS